MNETFRQMMFFLMIFLLMSINMLYDWLFDKYFLSIFETLIIVIGGGLILKLTDIQDELKELKNLRK